MTNTKQHIKKTYFYLNNELNIPENHQIPLYKDKEALEAFLKEEIAPKTMAFTSLKEKLHFLIDHDYIDETLLQKYPVSPQNSDTDFNFDFSFITALFNRINQFHFQFKSFLGSYKFYNQYALKTDDNQYYLENYADRVALNALYLGNGDKTLALAMAEELITQRYQPATPTFLNAGRKRRGEMVSCFLIDMDDSMLGV
ncbi:MAG: ribonucleotide reductase N-terminal alpha domain-containing protein, partial [Leuconostoc fallax]